MLNRTGGRAEEQNGRADSPFHPSRFRTSPQMHAILAFIEEAEGWTNPSITEMHETSDHFILYYTTENRTHATLLGFASDLWHNLRQAAEIVFKTKEEVEAFILKARLRIHWDGVGTREIV